MVPTGGEMAVPHPPNVPAPKRKAKHMVLEGMDPRYGLAAIMALPSGFFRHYVSSMIYDEEYQEAIDAYSKILDRHLDELSSKRDQFVSARLIVVPPPQIC